MRELSLIICSLQLRRADAIGSRDAGHEQHNWRFDLTDGLLPLIQKNVMNLTAVFPFASKYTYLGQRTTVGSVREIV